ncbi:hypothetical protein HOD29_05025 [archaeon]|nr:hypothetical protein [archaeon]
MTKNLEMIAPESGKFSKHAIRNLKVSSNPKIFGNVLCNRKSLIKESKIPWVQNLFGRCAKNTLLSKFKQGKKYRLLVGDPIKVDATLIGWTKLNLYYCSCEGKFLVFKTKKGNYILCFVRTFGEVAFTQILKTY